MSNGSVDSEPQSLWECLHDGVLRSIVSDRLARTVVLELDVNHLRTHGGLPDGVTFLLRIDEVASVCATTHVPWPGGIGDTEARSFDEQLRRKDVYWSKAREESVAWSEVERLVASDRFDVMEAELTNAPDGVALELECQAQYAAFTLAVRGRQLAVERSDGTAFGLAELRSLGEAYWKAFSDRAPLPREDR